VARQIGRAMDANEMRERVERLEQDVIVDIQDTIGTPWPAASSLRVYGRRRVRLLGAPPCCVRPYSQHTHWARAVSLLSQLCQSFERPCARLTVSRLADTVQKQVNQASEFLSKMRKESKLQEEDDSDENSDSISASTSSLSSSDEDDES